MPNNCRQKTLSEQRQASRQKGFCFYLLLLLFEDLDVPQDLANLLENI